MKSIIRVSLFIALGIFAVSTNANAQNRNAKKAHVVTTKKVVKVKRSNVKFKTPKKKVVTVRTLPNKKVIKHQNQNYYFANNRYYSYSGGRYIPYTPKVGFRTKLLPIGYVTVHFNNHPYYVHNGIFFAKYNNEYEVIDPEVGTIVSELPEDAEKVIIDGGTFYEYADILYERIQVDGRRAYEVVGILEM
ncbi:DUF6515 family protein [Portibacter lacus]|uniref:Uncharacterized protein n=1 Tax=Portibacter lacus TaxID=1099794 RepID=A0AA37SST8_9BACT|nr:DUF6515 family protein [Portibacter lacus]GLR17568.1 hypothetical protein GCM10007940_21830 [Portibacter lacus]